MSANVLVYLEHRDGRLHNAARQLLDPAQAIASARGGSVHAVLIGAGAADVASQIAHGSVAAVHTVDSGDVARYQSEHYAAALVAAAGAASAGTVMSVASSLGRDVMPRVAVLMKGRVANDCTAVSATADAVKIRRSMYSGKCVGDFELGSDAPQLLTIRPNSFTAPDADGSSPSVESLDVSFSPSTATTSAVERTGSGVKDVTEADVVVAGGRSLKSEDAFDVLEDIAGLLDGAVGASRAAVDAGYQPHARQIGLTGKVVSPRLYIATGIDGAIQHLAGMRGSKVIVAINTRDDAPIFDIATYGCVIDQFEFLPALADALRAQMNGN